ncbi:hypothetical protein [Streptomyces sp. NBC_01500]|uniref:hypothetical protein n=1 Tax=Streptomyces sp. NBC_01500 TaxID=2903886 RepID=UPI00224DDF2E|nr:hypothetical protein [Streptomyces sp. NBC_01500]MCX4554110.1 hypothetical protein [Streptomyces sp. NBC_01500]
MAKYRKKPVEIESVQWLGEANCEEVFKFLGIKHLEDEMSHDEIYIHTLEGIMTAQHGDWIIKGVQGEFYPCNPDIFLLTYEEVIE